MSDTIERMARAHISAMRITHADLNGDEWRRLLSRCRALLDGAPAESEADRAALAQASPKCATCGGDKRGPFIAADEFGILIFAPCPNCAPATAEDRVLSSMRVDFEMDEIDA